MTAVFLKLLDMSLSAGWLVLVVLVLRLVLRRAPRALLCALWALVAVRLLCPVTLEGVWSLMPQMSVSEQIQPTVQTSPSQPTVQMSPSQPTVQTPPAPSQDIFVPPTATSPTAPADSDIPVSAAVDWWTVAAVVWLSGVTVMVAYMVISTCCLRRRVRAAVRLEGTAYLCDEITTPFILGVLRPRIYLPSTLSDEERAYVLAHEQAHLKRGDHWIKPLGFLLLGIYWFHPLLWVAYSVLCRDIELACDERVIREMDGGEKARYSEILLLCSAPRRAVTACPLAFGEGAVKERVGAIVAYKKPTFWIVLIAVLALTAAAVFFLVDPLSTETRKESEIVSKETVFHHYAPFAKQYADGNRMGYAVADLDGDGREELIIGRNDTDEVTALYTWSEDRLVQLFQTDNGDTYRLYTDGYVKRCMSNGSFELFQRRGDELTVIEQIMHSPEYGEQIGSTATYFRVEDKQKPIYLPISYERAQAIETAFDAEHTPLEITYISLSESMVIEESTLGTVSCRYTVGDGEEQTLEASKATELYTYMLSVPWAQLEDAVSDLEKDAVRLVFLEDAGGTFCIYEDDTLVYNGPRFNPIYWRGTVPAGTYDAVTGRLNVTKTPSQVDPLSPTSDRLARTADWQTTGLSSIGLDGVTVQPYYDGAVGKVYLLSYDGIDFDKAQYVPWVVAVETTDTVWLLLLPEMLTMPLRVDVVDMTGDGIEEVFVSCDLGGQGGNGSKATYVYTVTETGVVSRFQQDGQSYGKARPRHGFTVETDEDGFVVRNAYTGYEERFLRHNPNRYTAHAEPLFSCAEPRDADGDGVYTLYAEFYVYMEYRYNTIGRCVMDWTFDGEQFRVTEAMFVPHADMGQTTLTSPEMILFRDGDEPDMLVRRGEDGRSLWVDTAGEDGPWRVPLDEDSILHYNSLHAEACYVSTGIRGGYTVVVVHDGYVDVGEYYGFEQIQASVILDCYESAIHSEEAEQLSMSEEEVAAMWPTADELIPRPSVISLPSTAPSGNVVLDIPTSVVSEDCYSSSMDVTVRVVGDRTLQFSCDMYGEDRLVELTNEEAARLNACFDAVTDFSTSDVVGSTAGYAFTYRQETYHIEEPKDPALWWFLLTLFEFTPF